MSKSDTKSWVRGVGPIKKAIGSCLLAVALVGSVSAQQDFSNVEVKSYHVQGQVWVLTGAGGNVTVQIGDEGVLIVDTQYAEMAPKLLAEIRRLAPGKIIRYIIDTHGHPDHVGGNQLLSEAGETIVAGNEARDVDATYDAGAEVIAHENVMLHMAVSGMPFESWPSEVYLGEHYELFFNDEPIELLYQGHAHTDGDTMVFFRKSDVISTGDIYVTENYPFIDLENGGNIQGIIDGLNQIIRITVPRAQQEGGTMVISGHGRLADEADVVDYRDMITIIRDRIQYLIDQGMSLDEVLEEGPTSDYDGRYGEGFVTPESFITAIYTNLSEM